MLNFRLGLQVSVKHWVILSSLHDLEIQKAVIFELELVYRPDVYKCYCSNLLSKVRGSGILFIFVFDLFGSSFYERNREKPGAEVTMTLRNYLPVDKSDCLTLMKAPQFSELLGTFYFKTAVRTSDLPVAG